MHRYQITIPSRLDELLLGDRTLHAAVTLTVGDFEVWLQDNKLAFFPEYTDHGPTHVGEVIDASASLVRDEAWGALSAADAAALILASLLHDCAMHLSEDGFANLVGGEYTTEAILPGDAPWPVLWDSYLSEASRFDGRTLIRLFGDSKKPRRPPPDWSEWTRRDRLLIGDFLRRHHPRLAHEIAMWGVPGTGAERIRLKETPERLRYVAGLIARSHGIDLRAAAELLPRDERREYTHVHGPFIMGVLRVADYIQIHSARAPGQVLLVRSLRSPVSRGEWQAHGAVEAITATHEDPEALFVKAMPVNAAEFVKLRQLLSSIQHELDSTWAVFGEVYGRFAGLSELGLTIRRIRSNLDDVDTFSSSVPYLPRLLRFDTAGADLLKLLVTPLYGANPAIGIRELLQNAVDALRERKDLRSVDVSQPPGVVQIDLQVEPPTLTVSDSGVGMDADVIANYFLRAGASFRNSDTWRSQHTDESGHSRVLRSGRFGIGALATFLLGEHMRVTTRNVREAEALTFSASMDDEVVEVRRTSGPVGTTIVVPLSPKIAEGLMRAQYDWDWYCLADPPVTRNVNGESTKQETSWPAERSVLPPEWRRLHHPDYSDIQWSCWLRSGPRLVVNGIAVWSYSRYYENRYTKRGRPEYLSGDEYHPKALIVSVPQLSVFDPDGNLSLTLQRDGLSVEEYPFSHELLESVIQDFVAWAALLAPDDPSKLGDWIASGDADHPLVHPPRAQSRGSMLIPFWITPTGWALLDEASFSNLSPERLLVAMRPHSESIGMSTVDFRSDYVLPMNVEPYGIQAANAWLRFCLGGASAGLGPLNFLRSRSAAIILSSGWFERVSNSTEVARGLLQGIRNVQHHKKWTLLTVGKSPPARLESAFTSLAESQEPREGFDGFAELVLEPTPQRQVSRVMSHWLAAVGSPVLPFAKESREFLQSHASVAACLQAYRELQRAGKLTRRFASEETEGTDTATPV